MADLTPLLSFLSRTDSRGTLTVAEPGRQVPFPIARVYWLHGVSTQARGHHAHHACRQALVAVAGGFTLHMDDGRRRWSVRVADPATGVLVEPMMWHSMDAFEPGTVCLVLASQPYDEADYIRDYTEFQRLAGDR